MSTTSKAACTPLNLLWKDICTLGWRKGVDEAAEHQVVVYTKREADNADVLELSMNEEDSITERLLGATYSAEKKDAAAGRALDVVVDFAGSRLCFGGVLELSFGVATASKIQIELTSFTAHHHLFNDIEKDAKELDTLGHATTLVPENVFDQIIVFVTDAMGSMWMLFVFIVGIAAWIGLGPLYDFSNNWQLWLNTATALQQTLSTCLLTLARKRHTDFVERCVCEIFKKDCEVEYRARRLVGYDVPNTSVEIEWTAEHLFERVLDWYAAFVGPGYSASVSLLLVAVWVSTGSLMNWGDDWWLIIGTWTGVVGTFNAAVLRYSLFRQEEKAGKEYNALIEQDKVIFNALGLKCACDQRKSVENELGCMARLSLFTSWACATPWAVMGTLALIIGLLIGATVVLWSETAQILVNSVTMVLESFFLIVLIEAHIIQAAKHRVDLHDLLVRRLQLLVILKRIEMDRVDACLLDSSVKNVSEEESDSLKLPLSQEEESV